ncbi:tethering factor for nuclear proteasome STS1 [Kalaharituber pfeilii]|nr:tethering factor for nuclear proteasome STS1 [Kalaharituber pfeilii]
MSTLLNPQPLLFPAQHNPQHTVSRLSPPRMTGRKRKADNDDDLSMGRDRSRSPDDHDNDEHMNAPSSPSFDSRALGRMTKRQRQTITGRPLPLNRVLETVDTNTLKSILREICNRHPDLEHEVLTIAPRPTVASALGILTGYENTLRAAFPYGGNSEGDYAYYRVKGALVELLDALSDYTPHFLPPNESQPTNSLTFLDGATDIIHRLPNWSTAMHNHHKQTAYEEISKAWVLVIKEAAKRGAGVQLQYGDWDTKVAKHNEQSGGRMQAVVNEIKNSLPGASEVGRPRFGMGFPMHSGGVSVRSW